MPADAAVAAPAEVVATPNAVVASVAASLGKTDAPAPASASAKIDAKDAKVADVPKDDAKKPTGADFSELQKRESKTVHRELAAKAKEAELAKLQAAHEADLKELAEIRALKASPLKLMEKFGLTYDQITELQLQAKQDPEAIVDRKIADLKKEADAQKAAAAEAEKKKQQEAYDASIAELHDECSAYVEANPEACELTKLYDGGSLIVQTIQQHYAATVKFDEAGKVVKAGRVLSIGEAAKLVEAEYEAQLERAQATKKFQAKQAAKAAPAAKVDPKAPAPKTLSNDLGGGAAGEQNAETDPVKRGVLAMQRAEERRKAASA